MSSRRSRDGLGGWMTSRVGVLKVRAPSSQSTVTRLTLNQSGTRGAHAAGMAWIGTGSTGSRESGVGSRDRSRGRRRAVRSPAFRAPGSASWDMGALRMRRPRSTRWQIGVRPSERARASMRRHAPFDARVRRPIGIVRDERPWPVPRHFRSPHLPTLALWSTLLVAVNGCGGTPPPRTSPAPRPSPPRAGARHRAECPYRRRRRSPHRRNPTP